MWYKIGFSHDEVNMKIFAYMFIGVRDLVEESSVIPAGKKWGLAHMQTLEDTDQPVHP